MAEYSITIEGVERDLLIDSLDVAWVINGLDTLSGTIGSVAAAYRPAVRDEVVLYRDATAIFGGIITQSPEESWGGPALTDIQTRISATSFDIFASYRVLSLKLPAGTLKSQLELIEPYFSTHGVVLHASQVDGPSMPELIVKRQRGDAVLNRLSELAPGYLWSIDASKNLRMALPTAAPFDILDTGTVYQIGDVQVDRTLDDTYANRVILSVTGAGPATSTETFVAADGVSSAGITTFTAKYPTSQSINDAWPNVLTFDGVVQGPIGFNTGSGGIFAWYWDTETAGVPATLNYIESSGAAFPSGGSPPEEIEITYAIGYPFDVIAENAVDIAAYGIRDRLVNVTEALPLEAAQEYADDLVAEISAVLVKAKYDTNSDGVLPAMSQTITIAKRDIDDSMVVQDVRMRHEPNADVETMRYSVTLASGNGVKGNWRQTYKDWLGGSSAATTLDRTGASGGAAAAPELAVQYRSGGAFAGSAQLIADPDEAGDEYGFYDLPAVLALQQVGETQDVLALWKAGFPENALTVSMSSDDICYLHGRSPGGFYIYNNDGDLVLSSVTGDLELESVAGDITLTAADNLILADQFGTFGRVYTSTVSLTDAQIKALPTTSITLVTAPAAGYRIVLIEASIQVNCIAGAYTNINADGYWVLRLGTSEFSQYVANQTGDYTYVTDLLTGADKNSVQLRTWLRSEVTPADGWGPLPATAGDTFAAVALSLFASNSGSGNYTGGHASNSGVVSVTYRIEASV